MSDFSLNHEYNGTLVPQRYSDGYVNVTALCQSEGKKINDYLRLKRSKAFIDALSVNAGIPALNLVEVHQGKGTQTYAHPKVAMNVAIWVSVQCEVWAMGVLVNEITKNESFTKQELHPFELRLSHLHGLKDLIERLDEPSDLLLQKFDDRVRDLCEPQGTGSADIVQSSKEWTVRDRLEFKEIRNLTKYESAIGRKVAKAYRESFGKDPMKVHRVFNGKQRQCTVYMEDHAFLIDQVIEDYISKIS